MAKQAKTNFTQIPNQVLDTMCQRTPAENLVLFAICRKTYGWQKTRDQISLSQIMLLTGISKQGVLNCLKSLKLNSWIESDKDKYGNILYMSLEKEDSELMLPRIEPEKWKKISDRSKPENSGRKSGQTIRLVKSVDRSNHLTDGSQTIRPNESNHLTAASQTIGHTKESLNKLTKESLNKEETPSLTENPAIPSQSGYDAFRAEYSRLYFESQNLKLSSRYIIQIEEIANMLDNDIDKLRILLSNFARSWWGVKGMRPTPDVVFKFLDKNADAQTVNYKGETTAAQRDKFGGDDSTVQKIANEAVRRAEEGARQYMDNGGLIF